MSTIPQIPKSSSSSSSSSSDDGNPLQGVKKPRKVLPQSDDDDTIQLNVKRQPMQAGQVVMYNDLGGGFRKDAVVDAVLEQEVADVFTALKSLIIQANSDQKVQIDVDNRIVWVREADGTGTVTHDLDDLIAKKPAMQESADKLIKLAGKVWPKREKLPAIAPGCKAPSNATAMDPSYLVKEKITNDPVACATLASKLYSSKVSDSVKQTAAINRIAAVESIISEMQKTIDKELELERNNEKNAGSDQIASKKARDAIALLEKHSVNRLALYVAVAFASSIDLGVRDGKDPVKALAAADQAAKDVQEVLQSHLDDIHNKMVNENVWDSLPGWVPFRGTPLPYPKDEAYAKWAGALVYSALPPELARKGAANYWIREKISAYQDNTADELVRLAVRKELDPATSVAEAKTPLIDEMYSTVTTRDQSFTHKLEVLKDKNAASIFAAQAAPADQAAPVDQSTQDAPVNPADQAMDARVSELFERYHLKNVNQ